MAVELAEPPKERKYRAKRAKYASKSAARTKLERYAATFSTLHRNREPFMVLYRDIDEEMSALQSARLRSEQKQDIQLRNQNVIDSSPIICVRVLGDGMNSGITSQARAWFRYGMADSGEASEYGSVASWLHDETQSSTAMLAQTNFYQVMAKVYKDSGQYGTGGFGIEEVDDEVLHFEYFAPGTYWIATDARGRVRVLFRKRSMTVRTIIDLFGTFDSDGNLDTSNLSNAVVSAWENDKLEEWFEVVHAVEPNQDYREGQNLAAKFKRFSSCWYEYVPGSGGVGYLKSGEDKEKFLRESGFDYFPGLFFRWDTNGEDAYGINCPGMIALPVCGQLQSLHSDKLKAVEKMVDPPMNVPASMRNSTVSLVAGAKNVIPGSPGDVELKPTIEPRLPIDHVRIEIAETDREVEEIFYKNLFLLLSSPQNTMERTAEEVRAITLERFTMLSSVLERVNVDILDPLHDILFAVRWQRGLIEMPPPELAGRELKVEYISILAQSQKMIGSASMIDFANGMLTVGRSVPSVFNKWDTDQWADDWRAVTGVNPRQIRPDQVVEAIRNEEARARQAAQAQEAMAAMKQGASAVKDLSGASMDGNSALTAMAQ